MSDGNHQRSTNCHRKKNHQGIKCTSEPQNGPVGDSQGWIQPPPDSPLFCCCGGVSSESRQSVSLQVEEEGSATDDTGEGNADGGEGTSILVVIVVVAVVVLDGLAGLGDDAVDVGLVGGDLGRSLLGVGVGGGGGAQGGHDLVDLLGDGGTDVGPGARGVVDDVVEAGLEAVEGGADVAGPVTDVGDGITNAVEDVAELGLRGGLESRC